MQAYKTPDVPSWVKVFNFGPHGYVCMTVQYCLDKWGNENPTFNQRKELFRLARKNRLLQR